MVAPRQDPRRVSPASGQEFGIPGIQCLEELGAGLRGTLYRATDGSRTLAVKVLRRGVTLRREDLGRFVRGAPGRLRHPNLPTIEALGETRDGLPYYSTALLRGDSLRTLLDDARRGSAARPSLSPLSVGPQGERHPELPRRAAELIAEAAEGLALAHQAGIVHRRLSPRNLIMTPAGRLVVTDFGGEASIEHGDDLAYRAPEQLDPFPEHIESATDVYTLGVILFEVLTGRLPFCAASPHDLQELILRGLADEQHAARLLHDLRQSVPPELTACVLKALANDPGDRYADAAELAADLRRFLRHEQPLALEEAVLQSAPPAGRTGMVQRVVAACALTFVLGAFWLAIMAPFAGGPRERPADHAPLTTLNAPRAATRPVQESVEVIRLEPPPAPAATVAPIPAIEQVPAPLPRQDLADVAASWLTFPLSPSDSGRISLDAMDFLAIHDALEERNDDVARLLLCAWDLEVRERVDAAPRPTFAWLYPNLEVEVGPGAPRNWTAKWISAMAIIDPESLLGAAARLAGREDLLGHLLGTLQTVSSEESRETVLRIVRERPVIAGSSGLEALTGLAAHTQLLELARSSLPLDLRLAALEHLRMLGAGAFLPELSVLALTSPEPALRRLALGIVGSHEEAEAVSTLASAAADPELAHDALAHLLELPADLAAPALIELLAHPRLEFRQQAARRLETATGVDLAAPLSAYLVDRRAEVREVAFATLAARNELRAVPSALRTHLGTTAGLAIDADFVDFARGVELFLLQARQLADWSRRALGSSPRLALLRGWAAAHLQATSPR